MGNRKSKLWRKERVSQWRIENLFNFNSFSELCGIENENKSNATDIKHEGDLVIPLENPDLCNLSNFGGNLIALNDNGQPDEQSTRLIASIIDKHSNTCSNSDKDVSPKFKQEKNSQRDCKLSSSKHRVRFLTEDIYKEDNQSIQRSNGYNSLSHDNKSNRINDQQIPIEQEDSQKALTQIQKRFRASIGENECLLTTREYGMRFPRSQTNELKTSRPNDTQSQRKTNLKETPSNQTDDRRLQSSVCLNCPKQQQAAFSSQDHHRNRNSHLTFGIRNTKTNTLIIPKSLIISKSNIHMPIERKVDQSIQCELEASGDVKLIRTCHQDASLQANNRFIEQQSKRNSKKLTTSRKRPLPTTNERPFNDGDTSNNYLYKSRLTGRLNKPRNFHTQNKQSDLKYFREEESVSQAHSAVNQSECDSTSKTSASINCVTIQSVGQSDHRRKPGLRRVSKSVDQVPELFLRSTDNSRSLKLQRTCRNNREDFSSSQENASKILHSKRNTSPETDKSIQYELDACFETDERYSQYSRYSQYTPTEDEVTFPTESCGRIKSSLSIHSGDLKVSHSNDPKSCHRSIMEWKNADCSCKENSKGKEKVSKSFILTDVNTSSVGSSVRYEPCFKFHAGAQNVSAIKDDDNKYTIVELKNNIEELRRSHIDGRTIFCHHFFVKIDDNTRRIFSDTTDRRIESICRQSACRIHVKGVSLKKKWQKKFIELLIFAENLQELEKCCKLFDSTFPSFMASNGLGLKR